MDQKWNPSPGNYQILLGTPVIGWGRLVITAQAPPENPERSTAIGEREAATQPLENGNLEDGELSVPLEARSAPEEGSPREYNADATLVLYLPTPLA